MNSCRSQQQHCPKQSSTSVNGVHGCNWRCTFTLSCLVISSTLAHSMSLSRIQLCSCKPTLFHRYYAGPAGVLNAPVYILRDARWTWRGDQCIRHCSGPLSAQLVSAVPSTCILYAVYFDIRSVATTVIAVRLLRSRIHYDGDSSALYRRPLQPRIQSFIHSLPHWLFPGRLDARFDGEAHYIA